MDGAGRRDLPDKRITSGLTDTRSGGEIVTEEGDGEEDTEGVTGDDHCEEWGAGLVDLSR